VAKKPAIADIPAATNPYAGSANRPATPRPPSVVKKSTAATIAESIRAFFQSNEPLAFRLPVKRDIKTVQISQK
jgi:hypothetical protein